MRTSLLINDLSAARQALLMVALLLSGALFPAPVPAAAQDDAPGVPGPETVIAAIPEDFPPTYFRDEKTGQPSGFAIEVMNAIAARAGLNVAYVYGHGWEQIVGMVTKGEADLIPSLGISPARKKKLDYTDPVEVFQISVFTRSRITADSLEPGMTVAVIQGSAAQEFLQARPGLRFVEYQNFSQALFDLLAGRVDAFVGPANAALKLARDVGVDDQIRIAGPPLREVKRAIAVRKGDQLLLDRLNRAIAGFMTSREYQAIYSRWYGKPKPFWTAEKILIVSGLFIVLNIAVMAVWRYRSVVRLNAELRENVARRTEVEEALRRYAADLETSNRELQHFASIASHDLQEPLRMVSSYLQLIGSRYKGRLDRDADEFIGYAVDGALRMKAMIEGLLAYARVQTRAEPLQPIDTAEAFDEALHNLRLSIEESGAAVTRDALPLVNADRTQLVQLFQNLIANALKFRGEAPPRVHVSAEQHGDEWLFAVRDNGIGFDAEHADRLFRMFQRLHGKEYPGSGIGLALCRRIVERHGGRIWAAPGQGGGSTFSFTLPRSGPGRPATAAAGGRN